MTSRREKYDLVIYTYTIRISIFWFYVYMDQIQFQININSTSNSPQKYCGVAPRSRSIERPLLINGYALSSGFTGNDCKSTQRPTSEYWKHIGGSFPR
jgi:hypothetical protein